MYLELLVLSKAATTAGLQVLVLLVSQQQQHGVVQRALDASLSFIILH